MSDKTVNKNEKMRGAKAMEKMTMLELKNNYTNQLYYAEKLELNNDMLGLYTFKDRRLLHDTLVGKATLQADYVPVAIMEIEL